MRWRLRVALSCIATYALFVVICVSWLQQAGPVVEPQATSCVDSSSERDQDWKPLYDSRLPMTQLCDDVTDIGFNLTALEDALIHHPCDLRHHSLASQLAKHRHRNLTNKRYFIALLLHNNAPVIPTLLLELLKLVALLATVPGHHENVFVSVYESGSSDLSSVMLHVFQKHLTCLGIAHRVVLRGQRRNPATGRIAFLAGLRNRALAPLYSSPIVYDTVLFFNDIFICASRVFHLLRQLDAGADMVCGADFSLGEDESLRFYDIWAAMDIKGSTFKNSQPFTRHPTSRIAYGKEEPFQVAVDVLSCWGGLAVVRADVFQKLRLRFRAASPFECATSECAIFPLDLWASNRTRIVLVPTVKACYTAECFHFITAHRDHRDHRVRHPERVFRPLQEWTLPKRPDSFTCCPLERSDESIVDFAQCFDHDPWWQYSMFGVPHARVASSSRAHFPSQDPHTTTVGQVQAFFRRMAGVHCNSTALVPATLTQVWHTGRVQDLGQQLLRGVVSWLRTNPCLAHSLLPFSHMREYIRQHSPATLPAFDRVPSLRDQYNLFRWAALLREGGVFADIDTVARTTMDDLLTPDAALVVGMENDFLDGRHWSRQWHALPQAVSLRVIMAAPAHPVIAAALESAVNNVMNPEVPFEKLLSRSSGEGQYLMSVIGTGEGPLTQSLLAQRSAFGIQRAGREGGLGGEGGVRVLGLNALGFAARKSGFGEYFRTSGRSEVLRGGAEWAEEGGEEEEEGQGEKGGEGGIHITQAYTSHVRVEYTAAIWSVPPQDYYSPWHLDISHQLRAHSLDVLEQHTILRSGHFLVASPETSNVTHGVEVWSSGEPYSSVSGDSPVFLWVRSAKEMALSSHTSDVARRGQGCVDIFQGCGPWDGNRTLLWERCWYEGDELDSVALTVTAGHMVAFTVQNHFCHARGDVAPRLLYVSEQPVISPRSSNLGSSKFVAALARDGQLRLFKSPAPSAGVGRYGCDTAAMVEHVFVGTSSVLARSDAPDVDRAIAQCESVDGCIALVFDHREGTVTMLHSIVPYSHQREGVDGDGTVVYGTYAVLKTGSVAWIRHQSHSPVMDQALGPCLPLDANSPQPQVNSILEAEHMCASIPECAAVQVGPIQQISSLSLGSARPSQDESDQSLPDSAPRASELESATPGTTYTSFQLWHQRFIDYNNGISGCHENLVRSLSDSGPVPVRFCQGFGQPPRETVRLQQDVVGTTFTSIKKVLQLDSDPSISWIASCLAGWAARSSVELFNNCSEFFTMWLHHQIQLQNCEP